MSRLILVKQSCGTDHAIMGLIKHAIIHSLNMHSPLSIGIICLMFSLVYIHIFSMQAEKALASMR